MNKHERYWEHAKCPRPESRVQGPVKSPLHLSIYLSPVTSIRQAPGSRAQNGVCPSTLIPPRLGPTRRSPNRSANRAGSGLASGGVIHSRSRCRTLGVSPAPSEYAHLA